MDASILSAFLGIFAHPQSPPVRPTQAQVSATVQPYAKWGKYALTLAQRRYPDYAIVDYLHVGRTTYTPTYAKETFKFWLRQGKDEFGVFVNVYFDPHTDHVTRVLYCESHW